MNIRISNIWGPNAYPPRTALATPPSCAESGVVGRKMRRRACCLAAPTACAAAAAVWISCRRPKQRVHGAPRVSPAVQLEAHWLLGERPAVPPGTPESEDPWANLVFHDFTRAYLDLHTTQQAWPLRVVSRLCCDCTNWHHPHRAGLTSQVPRSPTFISLQRPAHLPPAPNSSVYMDRPRRQGDPPNCLRTHAPALRMLTPGTSKAALALQPRGSDLRRCPSVDKMDHGSRRTFSAV